MKRIQAVMFVFVLIVLVTFSGCAGQTTDYANLDQWAYFENETTAQPADVFFICPTVYAGSDQTCNMVLTDEDTKANFLGATNMEKGIYDADCRFFAPYYRQAGLNVYTLDESSREEYFSIAYADVKAAFTYYLETCNNGRPLVIAGFSQGADMALRLMKDCFDDAKTRELLVACYAIGWRITQEEMDQYPHLKFATCADDTGVIIAFNTEAEDVTDSLLIPAGTKSLAINPLNWKTDSTPAEKTRNLGACFTDYSGAIIAEIPNLTGAYLDPTRGALKAVDISPADYPGGLELFPDGVYHLYDYQFFYRNLQENVHTRVAAYCAQHSAE